ncbi:MAG: 50S ribosomal protein L20 [Candidatus Pacebacteria bacterium]|nr:50S ribosomal protein L20 [Candidatus Paceibacterota bacterium]
MVRVKTGTTANKRRKRLLKLAKGFHWSRKNKYRLAKEGLLHAFKYSYRDRRNKKREIRRLWQTQINAGARQYDVSYSKFIYLLKQNKIEIDRKILSTLAKQYPEIFKEILERVKQV